MDRANKAMRQKFKRVQQNLGLAVKQDELQKVHDVDQRNQKVIASVTSYRKNISNCIKTGVKDEQVEKRKKKLDEYPLVNDLANEAHELSALNSSCLARVMEYISSAVNKVLEERIHMEQTVEKTVLEPLVKYLEFDKTLNKCKEKLDKMIIDVDIARKALNTKHDDMRMQAQQDLDSNERSMESQKDSTITDIYTLASKEQEIANVFAAYIEGQIDYHRSALLSFESALPEIRREISTAQPRPVFGVELEEHLRYRSGERISLVLETCCDMLRESGFNERGLFRVNGNNTKMKRMKAAFDAGQIENDRGEYLHDPHSICSVLKSYLRELPEPLLTNHLYQDWVNAIRLDGTSRIAEIRRLLRELPVANRDNLAFLMHFLYEMLQYENVTMMNAGNLSIVFGPNLIGNNAENDNTTGSKLVEVFLLNCNELFGSQATMSSSVDTSQYSVNNSGNHSTSIMTGGTSTSFSSGSDSSLLARSFSSPSNNHSLTVDTQYKNRVEIPSTSPAPSQYSVSPSPNRAGRPKQPAPAPPTEQTSLNTIRSEVVEAITPPQVKKPSYEASSSEAVQATFSVLYAPSPVINELYTKQAPREQPNNNHSNDLIDLTSLDSLDRELTCSTSKSPSQTSQDSMNEYAVDAMSRSFSEVKPHRPPPPVVRTSSTISQQSQYRPVSYHSAIANNTPSASQQPQGPSPTQVGIKMFSQGGPIMPNPPQMATVAGTPQVPVRTSRPQVKTETGSTTVQQHHPPIVHDSENRTLITLGTPERTNNRADKERGQKPPLPIKPKTEDITSCTKL